MKLNIGHKISSVAAVVLVLMLAVAGYSIHLTARISADLETVATRHMPVNETVARINVHVLEQGVLLQRLFILEDEAASDTDAAVLGKQRIDALDKAADQEFDKARAILNLEETDKRISPHAKNAIATLAADMSSIEAQYNTFSAHALTILDARRTGDKAAYDSLLPKLDTRQDAIFAEIDNLRRHVATLTDAAVLRADRDERRLLVTNSVLTVLAAILGLGLAMLITGALVRSVRRLVAGAVRVEAGELDTEVPVTTRDEVGQLTEAFNGMVGGLRLKERIKETFGKYMDPRIVKNLLDRPEFAEPGGERREMTVMFIDLKGFTSISEKLPPDQLVQTINGFFGHMTDAISANKGVVDKFMGDCVMAYWGPPFTDADEHAELACKAALEALKHLQVFRDEVAAELGGNADEIEIDLRIGISTGEMIVGTVGSRASRSFTVMGDPVNLGSRLEGANKAYDTHVMISERTRELAGAAIQTRELDLIRVKGKVEPTRVYELCGLGGDVALLPAGQSDRFDAGLLAYRKQDWPAATTAFQACLADGKDDPPSRVYLTRVAHLSDAPPPPDWDGVWVFETK